MMFERVILVHIDFPAAQADHEDIDEFKDLAKATGAEVVAVVTGRRRVPSARYFVGKGKAEEIQLLVAGEEVGLVIFNHNLTPAQERNLEKLFQCRVLDRVGLILDIFAQRARTFEGKLQVELAQLRHLSTRLVRGWGHLERQRGGIGLRGGPGEKQLEVDRRLLNNRIKAINRLLEKVRSQRAEGRKIRRRREVPTISLVGYTNAGKSTLFNKITAAGVYVADKLFATLDPTLRRIELPDVGAAILVDTVGFVRHLPHELIAAFRATLEETQMADLLLHVIDANDPKRREKIAEVDVVLEQIGADKIPQLLVYNKIDLTADNKPRIDYSALDEPKSVRISAVEGAGLDLLFSALEKLLADEIGEYDVMLTSRQGKLRANLYNGGTVISEKIDKNGNWHLKIRIKKREFDRLFQ